MTLFPPLDGRQEGDGFLAEWLPVVRVRELSLSRVSFVVPPGSPPEADHEVAALRTALGQRASQGSPLPHGAAVSDLIDQGSGALRPTHPLVFFNACRSAGQIDWFSTSLGWATQFLGAGAGAFVGTLWPVRSDSALAFADAFYRQLVSHGRSLGQASLNARRAIRDQNGDPTWLAYAVYGSPDARVTAA